MTRRDRARTGVRPASAGLPDRLNEVVTPVARAAGLDLEGLTVSRIGRRHLVRVTVDGDQGVGLDRIAEVSRAMSAALDAVEESGVALVPGEYVLEVSSPGVDRPLTEPRHWRRNVGRLVSVTVTTDGESRQLTGRILAAAERVTIDVDGETYELGFDQLGPGRIQVELNRGGADGDDDPADDDPADDDLTDDDVVDDDLAGDDLAGEDPSGGDVAGGDPGRIEWDGDEVGEERT